MHLSNARWVGICAAVVLALLAAAAGEARAELIVFRDGAYLHGNVVEPFDDAGFNFEKYDDGGVVRIAWSHLSDATAKKLRLKYGLDLPEKRYTLNVTVERVTVRNGHAYDGIVTEYDDGRILVKSRDEAVTLPAASILRREKVSVPAVNIYTPEEIYEQQKKNFDLATAEGNYRLGEVCREVKALVKAREHYDEAIRLDPTYAVRLAATLKALEQEMADFEIDKKLAEYEKLARARQFGAALAGLSQVAKERKGTPLGDRADKKSREVLALAQQEVVKEWYTNLQALARKKAGEKEIALDAARNFALRELGPAIESAIAEKFGLDTKTVKALFEQRGAPATPRKISYGDATFFNRAGMGLGGAAVTGAGAAGGKSSEVTAPPTTGGGAGGGSGSGAPGGAGGSSASGGGAPRTMKLPNGQEIPIPGGGGGGNDDLISMLEGVLGGGSGQGGGQGGLSGLLGGAGAGQGGGQVNRGNRGGRGAGPGGRANAEAKETAESWWTKASALKKADYITATYAEQRLKVVKIEERNKGQEKVVHYY